MSIERYELTDVQCNQIKDLFPEYRTGADRQKAIALCLTLFYGWLEVASYVATCLKNITDYGKRFIAAFVFGVIHGY